MGGIDFSQMKVDLKSTSDLTKLKMADDIKMIYISKYGNILIFANCNNIPL